MKSLTKQDIQSFESTILAYGLPYLSDLKPLYEEFSEEILNQNYKTQKQEEESDTINYGLELTPAYLMRGFLEYSIKQGILEPKNTTLNACFGHGSCIQSCLWFSGVANLLYTPKVLKNDFLSPVMKKRIRRSILFFLDREAFYFFLSNDIDKKAFLAKKMGKKAFFRLNVFSDYDFIDFIQENGANFYDYTRIYSRRSLENYHLTFSFVSENLAKLKLEAGENVSVIFEGKELPSKYLDYPVLNGDLTDNRYKDPSGIVVGLKRKATIGR